MLLRPRARYFRLGSLLSLLAFFLLAVVLRPSAVAATWDPDAFAREDIVRLCTVGPEEGEYCFPVWLVVIDGRVYVRLGSRAADRVEKNTRKPYLKIEIAGQKFEQIRADPVPDMAQRVSRAMADKYTSDLLIRWLPHPLTMRLEP